MISIIWHIIARLGNMVEIISSGSNGNAILYNNSILVSCGVPFSLIKPYYKNIQLILLDHIHSDHFNLSTIRKLTSLRPALRFGCCDWMVEYMEGIRNVDVFEIGKVYDYGSFKVSPFKTYHDVPNCGFRLFVGDKKIFHATDTAHLQGITAKGYDIYAIEHNYNEETVFKIIEEKKSRGEFAHQQGAINTHLSWQQAQDFFIRNKKDGSILIRLHESSTSL